MPSIRFLYVTLVATAASFGLTSAIADGVIHDEAATVSIATQSHLNDATALINKNMDMSGKNIAMTRSKVMTKQNDLVAIQEGKDAEFLVLPVGLLLTVDKTDPVATTRPDGKNKQALRGDLDERDRGDRHGDRGGDWDDRS